MCLVGGDIMPEITERIKGYARRMKNNPTQSELLFYKRLKKVLKEHYPYIRPYVQHPFSHPRGWYIIDFYLGSIRLGFEIDGGYHWNNKQLDKDLERDSFFDSKDIKLMHIPNTRIDNQRKRKSIENKLKEIIEKRIGEIRKITPSKYNKLRLKAKTFLITQ